MANKNKSFLTEEERSVLTPNNVIFPKEARERFFEVRGDYESIFNYVVTDTKKFSGK